MLVSGSQSSVVALAEVRPRLAWVCFDSPDRVSWYGSSMHGRFVENPRDTLYELNGTSVFSQPSSRAVNIADKSITREFSRLLDAPIFRQQFVRSIPVCFGSPQYRPPNCITTQGNIKYVALIPIAMLPVPRTLHSSSYKCLIRNPYAPSLSNPARSKFSPAAASPLMPKNWNLHYSD